ncbi:hypothetical protein SNEBB_004643 [Seison nebaliae]|nr:hypothetical protein SNEBB_004643 [Seison nebaliae]
MCQNDGKCFYYESPAYDPTSSHKNKYVLYCRCPPDYIGNHCETHHFFDKFFDENQPKSVLTPQLKTEIPMNYIFLSIICLFAFFLVFSWFYAYSSSSTRFSHEPILYFDDLLNHRHVAKDHEGEMCYYIYEV